MSCLISRVGKTLFLVISFLIVFPSFSKASDAEILKRLERLEHEVEQLKKENMRLRQAQETLKQDKKSETAAVELSEKITGPEKPKYDIQLYGRVKVDLNYDTAEFRKYNDWLGAVGSGDAGHDSTNFNPRDSRIGVKVDSKSGAWMSRALIETDFYGDSNGNNFIPRLRLGYVSLTNDKGTSFLVGQDWTPVAQLNPPIFDFGILAASGNLWWRVPQVTLRKKVGNVEILTSLMKHRRTDTAEEDRMPWVLGRVAYLFNESGSRMLALGGGYREETLSHNTYGLENDVGRWLVALELKWKIGKFIFMAEPWVGEGLEKEWLRYDMGVNTFDETGAYPNHRPDLIRAAGGFVSFSYALNDKQTFSMGYGVDDPRNDDMKGMDLATVSGTNDRRFTRNELYFLNTWYAFSPAIKIGAEIIHMETERFSDTGEGTRYTFSTMYLF